MPTVSICLPVYNGERFIAEAIESALSQTFTDFELLIADDCSTDGSGGVLQKYAMGDSRIVYWRNAANKGLFANYNESMSRACGNLIKPFAQDDVWEPTILERMVQTFGESSGASLVTVARTWIDEAGTALPTNCQFSQNTRMDGNAVIADCLLRLVNWIGEPSTVMFSRSHIGSGFDNSYYHLGDMEYWFRILRHGDYVFLNEALCKFRRHEQSTTNKNLKGLLFAVDMMRLGEQYSDILQRCERTVRDFKINAMSHVSSFVGYSDGAGDIDIDGLLAQVPAGESEAREQLQQFKELTYYALLAAAQREEQHQARIATLESEKFELESELARVLDSRYWKSTALVRKAVRHLKSAKGPLR